MFENKKYLPYLLILLVILVIIYFWFNSTLRVSRKEGFISKNWSTNTIKKFLDFEQTINPNLIFDIDVIQNQATEAEVEILLQTGEWPWNDETKNLYMDAIKSNTIIKNNPKAAMEQARKIYNQTIIREMLSWNSPEGEFLLRGTYSMNNNESKNDGSGSGTYGINSGLITKSKNLIRCGIDKNSKTVLQQTENLGNDGITGAHKKRTRTLDYNLLPNLLPGFRFINSPCDPCEAVNYPPQYSCPFSLTSNDPSPIWQSLWRLQSSGSSINKNSSNKFPILRELQSELNIMFPKTGITMKTDETQTQIPISISSSTTTDSIPATTS